MSSTPDTYKAEATQPTLFHVEYTPLHLLLPHIPIPGEGVDVSSGAGGSEMLLLFAEITSAKGAFILWMTGSEFMADGAVIAWTMWSGVTQLLAVVVLYSDHG